MMNPHPATTLGHPFLGHGLGLRPQHYQALLDDPTGVDWLEIISENYMVAGGMPLVWLDRIRERFPLVMHGVSLSIGGTDPLNPQYLAQLSRLARRIDPAWISDHLCWTAVHGVQLHDLMPLPFTEEAIEHIVPRVRQVQDVLGRRIALENVSSYLSFAESELTEWQFLSEVATRSDCLILLDINNIHVSASNHGFDPADYIEGLPACRIQQIHLSGHSSGEHLVIDTHDAPICRDVWELYEHAVQSFGPVSTSIEWDDGIPSLDTLREELAEARRCVQNDRATA